MAQTIPETKFKTAYHVSPQLLVVFLIFILSALTYVGILNHQFLDFDDNQIIVPRSKTFNALTFKNISNLIFDDYPREEPLIVRDLSYLVNGAIFGGDNPQGYLLGNLLLHMVASYLIFSLSLTLFPNRYWQAILTSILFAIHPIHVESVAWISSRKDTLYSCFFLAGFLYYSNFVKINGAKRLAVSLGFFILGLFSKASAISFFPVVLLYRLLLAPQKKWTWHEVSYFSLLAVFSWVFMRWYSGVLTDFGLFQLQNAPSLIKESPAQWLLLNIETITFYLGKLLYPQDLANLYIFPAPSRLFASLSVLFYSLATCAVLLFVLFKFIRMQDKRPLFLMLWFVLALGPYLNWAGISIYVADRYLYLASFAPMAAVSYLFATIGTMNNRYSKTIRNMAICLTALLFAALIARGIKAVAVWSSSVTLWRNALQVSPTSLDAYLGLIRAETNIYLQQKGTAEGDKQLKHVKAVANQGYQMFCKNNLCQPQATGLLYQIANLYYEEGRLDKAEQFLAQGLLLKPEDVYLNYLHIYLALKQGDISSARQDIEVITRHAHPKINAPILNDIRNNLSRSIPSIDN